jgi:hypothetical protein
MAIFLKAVADGGYSAIQGDVSYARTLETRTLLLCWLDPLAVPVDGLNTDNRTGYSFRSIRFCGIPACMDCLVYLRQRHACRILL